MAATIITLAAVAALAALAVLTLCAGGCSACAHKENCAAGQKTVQKR